LPGPAWPRGHDLEVGIVGGDPVEMTGVAMVEDHAVASGKPGAQTRRADEDQNGNAGLGAEVVVGLVEGVACRRRKRRGHGKPKTSNLLVDAAAQLANALGAGALRIDVDPMSKDDIAVGCLSLKAVIVEGAHLLQRPVFGVAKIEDGAHAVRAEGFSHLGFGVVPRFQVPGRALLGQFLRRLQRLASPRPRVRMQLDELHDHALAHALAQISGPKFLAHVSGASLIRACLCATSLAHSLLMARRRARQDPAFTGEDPPRSPSWQVRLDWR